ncbi:hypothetical protein WEI85_05790 [Actinomycetes bacterium KLBMP 9797]
MSRRLLTGALASAVVIVCIAVGSPAAAVTSEPWNYPTFCAEGQITRVVPPSWGDDLASVIGWAQPCPGADPAQVRLGRVGVARFGDEFGVITQRNLESLGTEATPTQITNRVYLPNIFLGWETVICLVAGPSSRIACAVVNRDRASGSAQVTPIPLDDPRVSNIVRIYPSHNPGKPVCGACV